MSSTTFKGTSKDPSFRRERARRAAQKRHSLETYIDSIVKRWPEVSDEQKSRLAQLLKPGIRRSDEDAA